MINLFLIDFFLVLQPFVSCSDSKEKYRSDAKESAGSKSFYPRISTKQVISTKSSITIGI